MEEFIDKKALPLYQVVIVGSGAAGVAAALELTESGIKPLILDVGHTQHTDIPRVEGNLYDYRKQHDTFDLLIGKDFQNYSNLFTGDTVPVKLTSPYAEYITHAAQTVSPIDNEGFYAIQSFAIGGLANAWGAGLYRYNDQDLEGFPIRAKELNSFFDKLTQEIGISGDEDDLAPFFGSTKSLLPPIKLSYNANRVYQNYQRGKGRYHAQGFFMGLPRVGVLTEGRNGRSACDYSNLEFWQELPYIYVPKMTLEKLITAGKVDYKKGIFVERWSESTEGIRINAVTVDGNHSTSFHCKRLVLAAGAINTAKIVLNSFQDYQTRLALLENPAFQIPIFLPTSFGRRLDANSFGLVQLNLVWKSDAFNCLLQGSVMETTSPMRGVFYDKFPLAARTNLELIKYILPATLIMQLYLPASSQSPSRLSLQRSGRLYIQGNPNNIDIRKMRDMFRFLRMLGAWSFPFLVFRVPTGHAIHYAGTLPMREVSGLYECDVNGKLFGTQNVYIADSSTFPNLPAKNMGLTSMANAMRIANQVANQIKNVG